MVCPLPPTPIPQTPTPAAPAGTLRPGGPGDLGLRGPVPAQGSEGILSRFVSRIYPHSHRPSTVRDPGRAPTGFRKIRERRPRSVPASMPAGAPLPRPGSPRPRPTKARPTPTRRRSAISTNTVSFQLATHASATLNRRCRVSPQGPRRLPKATNAGAAHALLKRGTPYALWDCTVEMTHTQMTQVASIEDVAVASIEDVASIEALSIESPGFRRSV